MCENSPENCVVDSLGRCHLADWGMALRVAPGSDSSRRQLIKNRSFRGKSSYAAPEIFNLDGAIDPFACDIFSLGCTLFVMLTGRAFLEPGMDILARPRFRALLREDFDGLFAGISQDMLSLSARHLIRGMTFPDPARRLKLEQVMVHPWVLGHCD
jgi:serine/threonine protein kinase